MLLKALLLGAIQGVTEFLPVSSTAHLVLAPYFMDLKHEVLDTHLFDALLHGGTLAALLYVFWKEMRSGLKDKRFVIRIVISSIPVFLAGWLVAPYADFLLRDPKVCAASLIVWGIFMIVAEKWNKEDKDISRLGIKDYLFLGCMQAIALIPGTSRSGITISSAFSLDVRREEALRLSFLMGIPVMTAAFLYELKKAFQVPENISFAAVGAGLIGSFIFGLLSLWFLVKFIKRFQFRYFAYYRFIIAALILLSIWKSQ